MASGEKRERRGGKYETVPDRLAGVCAVVHVCASKTQRGRPICSPSQKADVRELYEAVLFRTLRKQRYLCGEVLCVSGRGQVPFLPGME